MFLVPRIAKSLWLGLFISSLPLVACFPQKPQAESTPADASSAETSQETQGDASRSTAEVQVDLGVMMGSQLPASALSLVSVVDEVDYKLSGCASGNNETFTASFSKSLKLYKYDQNCRFGLSRIKLAGVSYTPPTGTPFDTSLNAVNTLQSSTGSVVYAFVQSQLPTTLTSPNYTVGFFLSEKLAGLDKTIPIYEVGVAVDRPQITEGNALAATFTVKRAVPAVGVLDVNLVYSGTAHRGVDSNVLPSSVRFADGQSQVTFTVNAVDDSLPEPLETITVDLGLGAYLSKGIPATVSIQDDDVAILSFNPSALSFGSRALNLPNALSVTLTNSGRGPATLFQLASGLGSPFYFPTGFPGEGGTCGNTIGAAQSCTIKFAFNPTALTSSSNTLTFSFFDGNASQNLSLGLQGTGANVGYLKSSLGNRFDFGVVSTATVTKKHVVVENLGGGAISALGATFSSPRFGFAGGTFPGTGGSCTSSLATTATCTLVIAYSPSGAGATSGTLTFSYNNTSQVLTQVVSLEGIANGLVSESQMVTTGLNTARAMVLYSTGGSGTVSYTIDKTPLFGTLTGTPPNVTYTPNTGYKGNDSFTFHATDSSGPSASAEIRLMVQPKAVFLVASPTSMVTMDTQFKTRLESKGFLVTLVDDQGSSTAQAVGQNLVAVSASVRPNSILTKYRDVRLPVVIWERGLYDDMKMIVSGATGANSKNAINVLENTSYMNRGYSLGSLSVLLSNAKINYVTNNDANVQKFSSMVGDTTELIEYGYDADAYMPGALIAPGRRLGTFYPNTNGDFTTAGQARIERNIDWLMQGQPSLLYDSFQRDASTYLGNGWKETESTADGLSVSGQELRFETGDNVVQAKNSFALQKAGIMTAQFFMNMQRTGSLAMDYQVRVQLGRCDLMDNDVSNDSGVAVHLLWGGVNAGLASENSLGYRLANGTTSTLGVMNSGNALVSLEMDFSTNTYKITSPLGTTAAIAFENNVSIDCMRIVSKNVNAQEFTRRGLHHLRVFQGN